MPTPYIETAPKNCANCGREFFRKPRTTFRVWASRTCCSKECHLASRRPSIQQKGCTNCGELIPIRKWTSPNVYAEARFCSRRCGQQNKPIGPKTRYRQTTVGDEKMPLHRAVMVAHLGRRLLPHEIVHHKNENTLDNRIENLQVMRDGDHTIHHHQEYPIHKECVICGAVFTPHKTKRKRQQQCGKPECKRALMKLHCKTTKLSDGQVEEIKRRRLSGEKLLPLANEYGISMTTVSAIAHGKTRA